MTWIMSKIYLNFYYEPKLFSDRYYLYESSTIKLFIERIYGVSKKKIY